MKLLERFRILLDSSVITGHARALYAQNQEQARAARLDDRLHIHGQGPSSSRRTDARRSRPRRGVLLSQQRSLRYFLGRDGCA